MNVREVVKHNSCFRTASDVTSVSIISVSSFLFCFAGVLEYTFLARNEVDALACLTVCVKFNCIFDAGAYLEEFGVSVQVVERT